MTATARATGAAIIPMPMPRLLADSAPRILRGSAIAFDRRKDGRELGAAAIVAADRNDARPAPGHAALAVAPNRP